MLTASSQIPDNINFDQAASVPLGLAAAVCSTWTHHPEASTISLPAPWEEGGATAGTGKAAFIVGGASSVAQYAIQAARMNGFSFIVTTASLKHESYLKSLGATHVIDRHRTPEEVLAELRAIVGEALVTFSYDSQADRVSQHLAYDALNRGGGMVSVDRRLTHLKGKTIEEDGKMVAGPYASFQLPGNRDLGLEVYKRLTGWVKDGTLVVSTIRMDRHPRSRSLTVLYS